MGKYRFTDEHVYVSERAAEQLARGQRRAAEIEADAEIEAARHDREAREEAARQDRRAREAEAEWEFAREHPDKYAEMLRDREKQKKEKERKNDKEIYAMFLGFGSFFAIPLGIGCIFGKDFLDAIMGVVVLFVVFFLWRAWYRAYCKD